MSDSVSMAPERVRQQPAGSAENIPPRDRDSGLDELGDLFGIFTPGMAQTQQRKLKHHIPCTWVVQEPSGSHERLGKPYLQSKCGVEENLIYFHLNLCKEP